MTTTENEGWPRLALVQPVPDDDRVAPEQLDQGAEPDPGAELVPVDLLPRPVTPPPAVVEGRVLDPVSRPAAGVRPVVPLWLRDQDTFRAAMVWAGRRGAHLVAFHGIRLPVYWLRLGGRSPLGLGRAVAAWSSGVSDAPGPAGATAAAIVFSFVLFGMLGRSPGQPVTSRSVDTDSVPRLTETLILTALASIGVGEMNKAVRVAGDQAVRFPAPITRDGPGWRADIDLPPGVTAGDVIERRDKLASGLRRLTGCVWPEADQDAHAGRLVLWVGDRPMSKAKPVPWPLAKTGTVDLFQPFPIGVDPRGRLITLTLMFALIVIGAIPRMGKSFFLRLLLLACALDVRCELHIFDMKLGADFLPLEPVAHRFHPLPPGPGLPDGDDDDTIAAALLADVRELGRDLTRRYKTIRSLPRDIRRRHQDQAIPPHAGPPGSLRPRPGPAS